MKTIINDNFLLQTETARRLYRDFAKDMPIIDYHCHLNPKLIAEDYQFQSVGEIMLAGDHYKWRAMRSFGIDEKYVTGDSDWREKFRAFAKTLTYCIGNPLYHWTHLELKRYFDIDEALTEKNADEIYDKCNAKIAAGGFSARQLIKNSGVEALCTTDDPIDTLEYHKAIAESGFEVKVLPTYRPDKVCNIHKETFLPYIAATGVKTYAELKAWLLKTIEHFHAHGCRLSDHGLDFVPYTEGDAEAVFNKVMAGGKATMEETHIYMTDLLVFFGKEFAKRGWCMQIHVGAIRDNNKPMYRAMGPDTGFDSIAETSIGEPLAKLLNALQEEDSLPKTILYSLNPKDNYVLGTLIGCFQKAPHRCKVQMGSGWWFNDQKDGMEQQLCALGNLGVLGGFVGMLTDSRSFISYPRHEYFRRILCNLIGGWVEGGMYPDDAEALENIVRGICYNNAKAYFQF
ncbi:MAG: glucuronate isomerase [Oscillospiraceae bacterium]|nr:glucuronate isomerase [Oscillospiraceae bacterium]